MLLNGIVMDDPFLPQPSDTEMAVASPKAAATKEVKVPSPKIAPKVSPKAAPKAVAVAKAKEVGNICELYFMDFHGIILVLFQGWMTFTNVHCQVKKDQKSDKAVTQRTLPSGLRYEVLQRGNGPQAMVGKKVTWNHLDEICSNMFELFFDRSVLMKILSFPDK